MKNSEKRSEYDKSNYLHSDHQTVLARFDPASVGVKYIPKFSKYLDFTPGVTLVHIFS